MADFEDAIFTEVSTKLYARFPDITVTSVSTYSPAKFPFVCLEESDSYVYLPGRDTGSNNNYVTVMYEVSAFSNKANGKKQECKSIMAVVDQVMDEWGFTRFSKIPITMDDATKYRITARYKAVVSTKNTIYRG